MEDETNKLVKDSISYVQNSLLMRFAFFDRAFQQLELKPSNAYNIASDGRCVYCNSKYILKSFLDNTELLSKQYLHTVLHCILQHQFDKSHMDFNIWNLACDITVEKIILQLFENTDNSEQLKEIQKLNASIDSMTAENIYEYYMQHRLIPKRYDYLCGLFKGDEHEIWYSENVAETPIDADDIFHTENVIDDESESEQANDIPSDENNFEDELADDLSNQDSVTTDENTAHSDETADSGHDDDTYSDKNESNVQDIWKRISRQMQLELEMMNTGEYNSESSDMLQNLKSLNREETNYADFLRKFSVLGEDMQIDEDSFDYIFYTYGLSLYKNIPLVEPLEYKEVKRIREFVIAIDTSGSVQGDTVQAFIQKTYNIMKQQESFFSKVNIHIIQCDTKIQSDIKITSQKEFDEYISNMELKGFGGTDFCPVFNYVEELRQKKELINLCGLIYFTDGYGTFPSKPDYKTAFVFLENEDNNPDIPSWAMKVILSDKQIKEF